MKAIVYDDYCSTDELESREVERPVPGADEVLVRVRAASLNPYDWHFMTGRPYVGRPMFGGPIHPKYHRVGIDLAGVVEEVGREVSRFRPGDAVYGMANSAEGGHDDIVPGTCAEWVTVAGRWLARIPERLTFEQAAAAPAAAITALQGLRDYADVRPGDQVLINGASGGVGTFAVQIAKARGAEVTGVCSTGNVELVRSLGADDVFDYTQDDFVESGRQWDVFLDNVGNRSLRDCRRVVRDDGIYLASFGQPAHRWFGPFGFIMRMKALDRFVSQRMVTLDQTRKVEDMAELTALIESGAVTPVVDRTYDLADVAEAMAYLEQGHARGKVVITVGG